METRVLKVPSDVNFGSWADSHDGKPLLTKWILPDANLAGTSALAPLREAAHRLRTCDVPVAFPTETVYGLGADATRSGAVRGIYAAKGRPSDNPLIVHVSDLSMLRRLLRPLRPAVCQSEEDSDPVPSIYRPLIARFWPGPLTILLPTPSPGRLAAEVTAGLATFGARIPASPLARTLIALVDAPLAAPSANASTKPSPTAARHVLDDLAGRIELILDGGACVVGVESTVVDGLCDPPVVLRPGGVSIDELRDCPGWEGVEKAYRDRAESGKTPRAPGMKYKHYSPSAKVVLYESSFEGGASGVCGQDIQTALEESAGQGDKKKVGIIRTRRWPAAGGVPCSALTRSSVQEDQDARAIYEMRCGNILCSESQLQTGTELVEINLGQDIKAIAHGLFSALRELDGHGVQVIFVEGVEDRGRGDVAAAVMNRLRKAASDIRA